MAERGEIEYLCCDHLAELTMSILVQAAQEEPGLRLPRDIRDLLRGALATCVEKGIKIVTNAGGANPRSARRRSPGWHASWGSPALRMRSSPATTSRR